VKKGEGKEQKPRATIEASLGWGEGAQLKLLERLIDSLPNEIVFRDLTMTWLLCDRVTYQSRGVIMASKETSAQSMLDTCPRWSLRIWE